MPLRETVCCNVARLDSIDRVIVAVEQVVIARYIGAIITDIAEESAERPVVVKRQGQSADRPRRRLQADAHVHGDAQFGVGRPLHGLDLGCNFAGLILEQIHRVAGVVPQ